MLDFTQVVKRITQGQPAADMTPLTAPQVEYKEGGLNTTVHRLAGRFKFTNVTLKKGIAPDGDELWKWVTQAAQGQIDPKQVAVTLYDLSGTKPLRTWTFTDAYPVKWSAV